MIAENQDGMNRRLKRAHLRTVSVRQPLSVSCAPCIWDVFDRAELMSPEAS